MVIALAFCGAVAAHPGHGTEYPDEINITTPDPDTGSTTGTSGTSSSTSKSSASSGKKSTQTEKTTSQATDNSGVQSVENTSDVEEVTDTTPDTNTTSEGSNDSLWNTAAIVGFLVVGVGAVGLFFKNSLFGR